MKEQKKQRNIVEVFSKAILAGILIGIACIANLRAEGGIIGAICFCIALLVIVHSKLFLYTGMIGKIVYPKNSERPSIIELMVTLVGNFVGTLIMRFVVLFSRLQASLSTQLKDIASTKISDTPFSIFILSIFCGVLVYFATYKFERENITDSLVLLFCVTVFVVIGFEHSIANSFYLMFADKTMIGKSILYFLIMVAGNSIGSMTVAALVQKKDKE